MDQITIEVLSSLSILSSVNAVKLNLVCFDAPAFMSLTQLMMTNAKKGVFQINVDLKSLQIKIAITNFVPTKLLQIVNSKFYKIYSLTKSLILQV